MCRSSRWIAALFWLAAMLLATSNAQSPQKGRPDAKGEVNTPPARGERIAADKLKVGDQAPDFTLPDQTGKMNFTLSSYQGKKPVVLVFGSYT